MKTFFADIKRSLTKSDIYTSPETNSAKAALKYILLFVVAIALIKAILVSAFLLPFIHKVKSIAIEAVDNYPKELVLTLADEKLSMNQPGPYIVPANKSSENELVRDLSFKKNILVVDTNINLDFKAFDSYETLALVTKDGFMILGERNKIEAQKFKSFPNTIISKTTLESHRDKLVGFLDGISGFGVLFLGALIWIALIIGGLIGALLFALLGTLVTFAVTRVKGYRLEFAQLYALSLYAYTAVIFVGVLKFFVTLPFWVSPLVFIGIVAAFVKEKTVVATGTDEKKV